MNIWTPRIISARALAEGERLPRGYGVAWALPYSARYYCLPVPLNRIAASCRAWWIGVKGPGEDPVGDAYAYGRSLGYADGRADGLLDLRRIEHIEKQLGIR